MKVLYQESMARWPPSINNRIIKIMNKIMSIIIFISPINFNF